MGIYYKRFYSSTHLPGFGRRHMFACVRGMNRMLQNLVARVLPQKVPQSNLLKGTC